jgi:hypothetical protein
MAFRNSSESEPAVVEVLRLSACTEQGVVITAGEQLWASQNYGPLRSDRVVVISVFGLNEGAGWQPPAKELVAMLESEWQGKLRFRDGNGLIVLRPADLVPQASSSPSR